MQTATSRHFLLALVLLVGAGVFAVTGGTRATQPPRWPESESIYAAQDWIAAPPSVEQTGLTALVTREFHSANGASATLTIVTSRLPKLYGAGPEVPFLGTGYTVENGTVEIDAHQPDGIGTLVADRGAERWLVMYAYGEDRGLLGTGPLPWALAVTDGILGMSNDYYKLYLTASGDAVGENGDRNVSDLARTVFPRIAAWYGSESHHTH